MNADKYQTRNDVIHKRAHTTQKVNAFCQFLYNKQSLFYNLISQLNNPFSKSSTQFNSIHSNPLNALISHSSTSNKLKFQKVCLTTRKNPQFDTYLQSIRKRKRAPNKAKMSRPSKTLTSIITQTKGNSHKGLGRAPLRDDPDITI